MHPFQPPSGDRAPPSSGGGRKNNSQSRLGLGLSIIPVPARTPSLPVPFPIPPTITLSHHQPIDFSDLDHLDHLGAGRGGVVFKVVHRLTNEVFALKIITGNHNELTRRQILREMEILRKVDHQNVIKCHDMHERECKVQLLLEYMDEGSLDGAEISHEATLAKLTKQILMGLAYLHRNRIVHRDIKPSNLLMNSNDEVKIADFGVSRILSATMDPCSSSVGTIAYMSPERINPDELNNGGYNGYAGDVWSLGLCVLEFYKGEFPLNVPRNSDFAALTSAICLNAPPVAPPTSSKEFQDFVGCCLKTNPTERWTAAMLLRHPFIVMYAGATPGRRGGGNTQGGY